MSEVDAISARRKLPPLGQIASSDMGSLDRTPRKRKKKKPPASGDSPNREGIGRVLPKPGSARSLTESESNTETARSGRAVPSRPKSRKSTPTDITDALEDIEDEAPRPPKKKKTKAKAKGSQEQLVENGHVVSDEPATDRSVGDKSKRKRKKKKVGVTECTGIGLEADLQELEDDIITEATETFEETRYGAPTFMRSEPLNKLFIEQKSGFKAASKEKIARKRAMNQQQQTLALTEMTPTKSTIQFAISSQNIFRTFVLFLQGVLAGVCLWQIITVYMLSRKGYDVLLEQYKELAMPVQCMYYFLLALSTVAVFDKNDIARPTKSFIVRSLTMQTTAIACFFYLAGLVFSLSVIRTDDRISQYEADKSLWENDEVRDKELKRWVTLNLIRGILPLLGWLIISVSPKSDRLVKNLEKADENILGGIETADQGGALRSGGV